MSEFEQRRDQVVEAAIAAGKIPPERREAYRSAWDSNPVATERLLAELAPGLPLEGGGLPEQWFGSRRVKARGSGPPSAPPPAAKASAAEGLPWVPRRKAARAGRATFAREDS